MMDFELLKKKLLGKYSDGNDLLNKPIASMTQVEIMELAEVLIHCRRVAEIRHLRHRIGDKNFTKITQILKITNGVPSSAGGCETILEGVKDAGLQP